MLVRQLALSLMLALGTASALPIPSLPNSEHSMEVSSLEPRLASILYKGAATRKQIGGTLGAGLAVIGGGEALAGWYVNHEANDLRTEANCLAEKKKDQRVEYLEEMVERLREQQQQQQRATQNSQPRSSLVKRWGGSLTKEIMTGIEDYGKFISGAIGVTAGTNILTSSVHDYSTAKKDLERQRPHPATKSRTAALADLYRAYTQRQPLPPPPTQLPAYARPANM